MPTKNLTIKKVIYNPPATIVLWNDGTKTTAKCDAEDNYSKETGLMLCILKKKYGKKWVKDVLNRYVYNADSTTTRRGTEVNTHNLRKTNVVKKKIKAYRPSRWLELEPIEYEASIEITDNDFIRQMMKVFDL